MHRPPAVAWNVIFSRWQKYLVTSLVLFAGLAWAVFTVGQGWGVTSLALLLALLVAVLLSAMAQRNAPIGQLRWDGEHWYWIADQDLTVRNMVLVMDFQLMMLLQVTFDKGQRHWFWLDADSKPSHWIALRRAIVSTTQISHDEVNPAPRDAQADV